MTDFLNLLPLPFQISLALAPLITLWRIGNHEGTGDFILLLVLAGFFGLCLAMLLSSTYPEFFLSRQS